MNREFYFKAANSNNKNSELSNLITKEHRSSSNSSPRLYRLFLRSAEADSNGTGDDAATQQYIYIYIY